VPEVRGETFNASFPGVPPARLSIQDAIFPPLKWRAMIPTSFQDVKNDKSNQVNISTSNDEEPTTGPHFPEFLHSALVPNTG